MRRLSSNADVRTCDGADNQYLERMNRSISISLNFGQYFGVRRNGISQSRSMTAYAPRIVKCNRDDRHRILSKIQAEPAEDDSKESYRETESISAPYDSLPICRSIGGEKYLDDTGDDTDKNSLTTAEITEISRIGQNLVTGGSKSSKNHLQTKNIQEKTGMRRFSSNADVRSNDKADNQYPNRMNRSISVSLNFGQQSGDTSNGTSRSRSINVHVPKIVKCNGDDRHRNLSNIQAEPAEDYAKESYREIESITAPNDSIPISSCNDGETCSDDTEYDTDKNILTTSERSAISRIMQVLDNGRSKSSTSNVQTKKIQENTGLRRFSSNSEVRSYDKVDNQYPERMNRGISMSLNFGQQSGVTRKGTSRSRSMATHVPKIIKCNGDNRNRNWSKIQEEPAADYYTESDREISRITASNDSIPISSSKGGEQYSDDTGYDTDEHSQTSLERSEISRIRQNLNTERSQSSSSMQCKSLVKYMPNNRDIVSRQRAKPIPVVGEGWPEGCWEERFKKYWDNFVPMDDRKRTNEEWRKDFVKWWSRTYKSLQKKAPK